MQGIKSRPRVVIENVQPEIDAGRFPIKRVVGERVIVEADIFGDGHDEIAAALLFRSQHSVTWSSVPMTPLGNDRWTASFTVEQIGEYRYTIRGWIDAFRTWRRDLRKRLAANQDVSVDLQIGAELLSRAAARATDAESREIEAAVRFIRDSHDIDQRTQKALDEQLFRLVEFFPDLEHAALYDRELTVWVDRERARFSAWYELFPRSCSPVPDQHGTLRDVAAQLPRLSNLGFDVLYLPPIHPVGRQFRKGKNNAVVCQPDDVGSPWGIGGPEGGHTSIHPQLGTLDDFHYLVAKAREQDMEIALDIAFQCSPDHPWVREHPSWFRHRPDGTIQYAENPPKKYQDIYPIDFETADWEELWEALQGVFLFWIEQGVKIFRVDNPHTKALNFWEWCIAGIRQEHPEVIYLSEAFTRPKVMYRLEKLGFTQSYTYFTWRNGKQELIDYFTELTRTQVKEFFRPNLWPNTPDILHAFLQHGGRPAFMIRLVLATTLGASYGLYGPAYELCVNVPREPGSEEYLNSEKYEIKRWELDRADSLAPLMGRLNQIRKANAALHSNDSLVFHHTDNDALLCYSKTSPARDNVILVVVNLDPHRRHWGFVQLALDQLGLGWHDGYTVHDLLTDARYGWQGPRNYVELNPHSLPAHVFRIER